MAGHEGRRRPARELARVVAVTGVRSGISPRLLRRLDDDGRYRRLVLVDRQPPPLPLRKGIFYRLDLTAPGADARLAEIICREGVQALVHLAFHQRPAAGGARADELGAMGTMRVLDSLARARRAEARVRHLLVLTSTLVYGAHPDNPAVLDEGELLRGCPGYPFVEEKLAAEEQVARFPAGRDMAITVLRPCGIVGPTVESWVTECLRSRWMPVAAGYDPLLQLVHEEDVVDACRLALERAPAGAFNVVGGSALPVGTCLRLAGTLVVPVLPGAAPLLTALWRLGLAPLPGAHLAYLRYPCVAGGSRIQRELGFRPRYTTRAALESFLGRPLALAA